MQENEKIILNIGCGKTRIPGSIGVDRVSIEDFVDVVHDLDVLPYPFPDNYADEIHLYHVLEHLHSPIQKVEELHRILKPGGVLHLRVPHFSSLGAFTDITHVRPFGIRSFDVFDINSYHSYYSEARFSVKDKEIKYFGLYPNTGDYEKYIHKNQCPVLFRPIVLVINFLIRLNTTAFERFWCYWVGGATEIVLNMVKPQDNTPMSSDSTELDYSQYTKDIFKKLDINLESSKSLLDVGCGNGIDSQYLREKYKVDVTSLDIYEHPLIEKRNLKFIKGSILDIPFSDNSFDYVFLHDVLHHVDEENQSIELHKTSLTELKRIVKPGGEIFIVEGNRYNPMFYPHMVKMRGHDHFSQSYFKSLISSVFPDATFSTFEAHLYPKTLSFLFSLYERLMESIVSEKYRAYNIAHVIVRK